MKSQTTSGAVLSRRQFLASSGGLTFAVTVGAPLRESLAANAQQGTATMGAWVRIDPDDWITIYNPASEMGQGSMTALPVIVADEMDADWEKVRIEQAPVEREIYGNPTWFGGRMLTVGSRTVQGYYHALRIAGAQVRAVLLENAARVMDVPVEELTTEASVVVHTASGRRLSYGHIAAATPASVRIPEVSDADLKARKDFRLIGTTMQRRDIPDKVMGKAIYSIDVQRPGMVYAVMTRCPVNGARPVKSNATEFKQKPGVIDVVDVDYGIAIVSETIEGALSARKALQITWTEDVPARRFDSEASFARYREIAESANASSTTIHANGNPKAAFARAAKIYSAEYSSDHAYHAQMEPLNAVAEVNAAGDGAEVWAGTQFADGARDAAASALGVSPSRIQFHPCYLGGGFGRRSLHENVVEAVRISKSVKRPVKLIWSREDDVAYGAFRPMALQRLEAAVNERGDIDGWRHIVVGDGGRLLYSGVRIPFYGIPNQEIALRSTRHGVRLKHWRAVGHGFNKLAIEGLIDEIAADQKIDPYEFRRRLMKDSPRALKVLDTAAAMAGWGGSTPQGRARGIAFSERSDSLAAAVAEVSLDQSTGKIRVHRFWASLDAGVVVQPANAVAQMESGIVYGLSSIIAERITFRDGAVQQSNFHDYPVMRMSDAPESIEIRLIESDEPPTGIGESGVPIVTAAVANAFAALTGARLRHMPFTPDRVRAALEA